MFFSSIKGGFQQQSPRPTCDCISGPRLIPAVLWSHPAYIMRALPHVGLPYQEIRKMHNHTTMDPGPLWHTAPHAHDARPLDLTLRVGGFQPAHPDYSSFPNWPETRAVQVHYRSTVMHRLHTCST